MCEDRYQYLLELSKRPSGTLLGRTPIQADWTPIQEALSLELVRRSASADFGSLPTTRIEPRWSDRADGRFVRGVSATAVLGDEKPTSLFLPIDYFCHEARRAAERFVKAGELARGELFDYRVLAVERQPAAAPGSARFAVEEIAPPVAITPAALEDFTDRALLFGADAADDLPVFVHWRVFEEASVLTRAAGALETGGILIGHVCRDSSVPELFLEVTAQIPAPARSQLTRLSFSPDTWSVVQALINRRDQNEVWLGWWHSHSFFKQEDSSELDDPATTRRSAQPFLSDEDLRLHRTVFPRAYSLALLMTDSPHRGMSWTMFGWRLGTVVRRDFHVIHAPLPEAFTPLRGTQYATT